MYNPEVAIVTSDSPQHQLSRQLPSQYPIEPGLLTCTCAALKLMSLPGLDSRCQS